MCGLIGALLEEETLDRPRLMAPLSTLQHRGPDARTAWISPDHKVALGHVRLSVVGLANGAQPLVSADGELRCIVNGELYGYAAQRAQLRAEGYAFTTDSDSEVALHLYDKLGADSLHELRGEFALIIADARQRCLFAARDRYGVKPLYYAVHRGNVFVASEAKALFALGVPARWDLASCFADAHVARSAQRTLFAGVHALPPGCYLLARDGMVTVHRYFTPDFPSREILAADTRSEAEVVRGFRAVLEDAVEARLVADVEVGAYLSGGIDSSAILGLAQRHASRPIRAFTIAFGDALYNEERIARDTARFAGASYFQVEVTQQQIADAFSDAIWHGEMSVFNGHGVAKFLLSKAVRAAGIKVVLTGEGADEIVAGYPPFRLDAFRQGGQTREEVERRTAALEANNQASRGLLVRDGALGTGTDAWTTRLGWLPAAVENFSSLAARAYPLMRASFLEAGRRAHPYRELLDTLDVRGTLWGRDPLNQALSIWTRTMLPNYILTNLGDRMEMAHSVEGRVPFLDHHVTSYAAQLPVHYKIRGEREKYVLREAVRDVVTPEVYARQKHPFVAPPARDNRDPLSVFCRDVLASSAVEDQPFYEPARVRALLSRAADLPPAERASLDSAVVSIASMCVLQERFKLSV